MGSTLLQVGPIYTDKLHSGLAVRFIKGLPSGSVVKYLPTVQEPQEMWVRSLGREDSLDKGTATHSSILAWEIPWTEEPGGLQSVGLQRIRT